MTYIAHITPDTSTLATFPNAQGDTYNTAVNGGYDCGDAQQGTARGWDGGTAKAAPCAAVDCGRVSEIDTRGSVDCGGSDAAAAGGYDGGSAADLADGIEGGQAFVDTLGLVLHLWHVQTAKYYRLRVVDGVVGHNSATLRLFFNSPAPAGQYNYRIEQGGNVVSDGILQITKEQPQKYTYHGRKNRPL